MRSTLALVAVVVLAIAVPAFAADTSPPAVTITAPAAGGTVQRGSVVYVTFTANDDSGLAWVDVTANGQPVCSVLFTPNVTETSCPFTVAKKPGATYTFEAVAHDGCTGTNGSYSCPPTWDGTNSATVAVTVTAIK